MGWIPNSESARRYSKRAENKRAVEVGLSIQENLRMRMSKLLQVDSLDKSQNTFTSFKGYEFNIYNEIWIL